MKTQTRKNAEEKMTNEAARFLGRRGGVAKFEKHGREAMVAMAKKSWEVRRKKAKKGKKNDTVLSTGEAKKALDKNS